MQVSRESGLPYAKVWDGHGWQYDGNAYRAHAATGRLTCEGTVTHLGGRCALAQARLTGADGKLYAHATSSCMKLGPDNGVRPPA